MIGEIFGSYRIDRQIGSGGMGFVYQATHQLIGRTVAVKILRPEVSRNREMMARFFNEARTCAMLHHPGLVEVFDFGTHPRGAAYLVMELLEGEGLGDRLAREGRLAPWLACSIMEQVAAAVGAAHAAGVIHRDLKPANIFLVPDRSAPAGIRAKVLDFGVAKLAFGPLGGTGPRTVTGSVLGTPRYMSPEQCGGSKQVDYRADIYSLGCVLFEMLTGRTVFTGQALGELFIAHQTLNPPALALFDPSLPEELNALVQRMLAKRAVDRPASLQEVEVVLANIAGRWGWDAYTTRRTSSVSVPAIPIGPSFAGPAQPAPDPTQLVAPRRSTISLATATVDASHVRPRRKGAWTAIAGAVAVAAVVGGGIAVASLSGGGEGAAAESAGLPSTWPSVAEAPPVPAAPEVTPPAAPPEAPPALVLAPLARDAGTAVTVAAELPAAAAPIVPDAAPPDAGPVPAAAAATPPDAGPPDAALAIPTAAPVEPAEPVKAETTPPPAPTKPRVRKAKQPKFEL